MHDGHIESNQFFGFGEAVVYLLRNAFEFFGFVFLTDKGFYNPYSMQIFLYYVIEFVIDFENFCKNGVCKFDDNE